MIWIGIVLIPKSITIRHHNASLSVQGLGLGVGLCRGTEAKQTFIIVVLYIPILAFLMF